MRRQLPGVILAVALFLVGYVAAFSQGARLVLPRSFPPVAASASTAPASVSFPGKRWVHRVNSIERARAVSVRYAGMEIDVHFDSARRCFDVGHEAAESVGLCVDSLIAALAEPRSHYYWLDFKNLDEANQQPALAELLRLQEEFGLAGLLVVESPSPSLLTAFTEAGLYTSYYLPTLDPRSADDSEISAHVAEVASALGRGKVNAISGYDFQYPVMREYFPHADKLLWENGRPGRLDLFARLHRQRLMRDPRVRVLLVRHGSAGYR
jgi:hypothetical protein